MCAFLPLREVGLVNSLQRCPFISWTLALNDLSNLFPANLLLPNLTFPCKLTTASV